MAMVTARAETIVNLLVALRRGNIKYFLDNLHVSKRRTERYNRRQAIMWNREFARDNSKAAGNLWLEYSYGWVPFMSEVRSAVNTLMDVVEQPASRTARVSASKKSESVVANNINWPLLDNGTHGRLLCDRNVKNRESVRVVWEFGPTSKDLPGRFGLLNPLEVAWELVPFSFVADWFLPIGSYLSQLDVPYRFNHIGGTVGRRVEQITTYSNVRTTGAQSFPNGLFASSPKSGVHKYVRVSRSALTSIPTLKLQDFTFNPNLSPQRLVSSIALIQQQLSRLR